MPRAWGVAVDAAELVERSQERDAEARGCDLVLITLVAAAAVEGCADGVRRSGGCEAAHLGR